MHSHRGHAPAPFMDFHYYSSKSRLISNNSKRTLISKKKYVNGICELDMDNYDDMRGGTEPGVIGALV